MSNHSRRESQNGLPLEIQTIQNTNNFNSNEADLQQHQRQQRAKNPSISLAGGVPVAAGGEFMPLPGQNGLSRQSSMNQSSSLN
jgi:hypothetical protein